jgi:hypothetical protein
VFAFGGAETSGVTGLLEHVHLQKDMELLGHSLVELTGVPTTLALNVFDNSLAVSTLCLDET